MKCPLRSYFSWLCILTYLVQYTFMFICCMNPSQIFHSNETFSVFAYIESLFVYSPWIFGSSTLMTDSIFFFAICIIPFFIIIYSQAHIKKFNNQKHVNFWCALVIRICQQFLTPIMTIPVLFRFSYFIEQLFIFKAVNIKLYFSFIICTINIILLIIHCYFSALFLVPIDFVFHSRADFYDGKQMTEIFVIRLVIGVITFMVSHLTNAVAASIVISINFFICFLTLYFRLTIQVHVSAIGQYLEVVPFFACPFMVLFKYFIHNEFYSFLFLIFLYIVFALIFKIHNYFIVKQSLKAFSPFMGSNQQKIDSSSISDNSNEHIENNNSSKHEDFLPNFFIGSVISVIRIVSAQYSDPDCLLRFLAFQKKSSEVKNSYLIEVVRLLALFPSRRKDCLKELKNFQSNSNFNCFTVFIFKKILKGLINIESTEKNLVCLNNFYRSYLVHKHLYWVARKQKKIFFAAREALSAAYFFIEVKNEFHYLLKRYSYDSFLHYYYADFYLSACGDFESYIKECKIARMLDNMFYQNKNNNGFYASNNSFNIDDEMTINSIVDPLLHPMSIINPKILQFCSSDETRLNFHITNKNKLDIHQTSVNNNIKVKNEKIRPVATFLNHQKHLIPLLSIFHIYVPIALFLYVISEIFIKNQQVHKQSDYIYSKSVQLLNLFYIASSTIYLPYLSFEFSKNINQSNNNSTLFDRHYKYKLKQEISRYDDIFSIDEEAMTIFISFPFDIINFYTQVQQLGNLTSGILYIIERYIANHIRDNNSIRVIFERAPYNLHYSVNSIFNETYRILNEIKKNSTFTKMIYKKDLENFYICKIVIVTISCFTFLSVIIYIIQINCIDRNNQIKIEFLSSENLFTLFLLQESKKAWELLREYKEASSDIIASDVNSKVDRSSIDISNINLSAECNLKSINLIDINENKPNQIDTNSIQEPLLEMTISDHNFSKDLRSLVNSNNYIQIKSESNYKFNFFYKKPKAISLDEIKNNSEINHNIESSNQIVKSEENSCSDNSVIQDIENTNYIDNISICNQAITIAKATEKEAFLSGAYFHLIILLSAPLIFTVAVIAMLQIPLFLIAEVHEETFKNILNGESMANHSIILLNETFNILDKKLGIANIMKNKNEFEWKKYSNKNIISNHFEINRFFRNKSLTKIENKKGKKYESFVSSSIQNNLIPFVIKNNSSRNTEKITGFEEIISDLSNLSSFHEEICYEFFDIVCMSFEKAINIILNTNTEPSIIATRCIPFVYLFSLNLFHDYFFSSVIDFYSMKNANGSSFIISTVLLMLTVVHVSFSSSLLLRKAFNSLFHFPIDFLNPPKNKSKDKSNLNGTLPKNALVITTITKSDEIYSVSDNSKEILNRNFNDLISLKMSEVFPKVSQYCLDDDFSQICEFAITDKNKKMFRYSTEQIGCLTKTVLIEEDSSRFENTREKSYVQKLYEFIPPHFAELFGKNDQYEFNYFNNFILSVRISNEISPQMIEKCFNAANHISQYSISLDIINVDGEMITFTSTSNCKLVVIFLLIRDFIDDVLKITKIQNCIYSIYVHFMDYFQIRVVDDVEPYLEFSPNNLDFYKFRLFQIERGKIAFSENFKSNSPSIIQIAKKGTIPIDFDENKESIYSISINELASKIIEFV